MTNTTSRPGAWAKLCCVMTWMPSLEATKPPSTDSSTDWYTECPSTWLARRKGSTQALSAISEKLGTTTKPKTSERMGRYQAGGSAASISAAKLAGVSVGA